MLQFDLSNSETVWLLLSRGSSTDLVVPLSPPSKARQDGFSGVRVFFSCTGIGGKRSRGLLESEGLSHPSSSLFFVLFHLVGHKHYLA